MSELCYKNDYQINNNFDDEKNNNNNNKNEQIKLSQLIDIKNDEMCKYGHGGYMNFKDKGKLILDNKCIQCSSINGRKYCLDCSSYNKNDVFASSFGIGIKSSDVQEHIYCINCRKTNSEIIKKKKK
eukprot:432528_1